MKLSSLVRHRVSVGALVVGAIVVTVVLWAASPIRPGFSGTIECRIETGAGATSVATALRSCGVIRSELAFLIYARLIGVDGHLQAGTYVLSPAQPLSDIVRMVAEGRAKTDDIVLTVPEGSNIWQIDKILLHAGITKRVGQFSSVYGALEGRLFPETYRFAKDATPADVALRMRDEFMAQAGEATLSRIIIASMLEKEAKTADDMALVAGIIQKRITLKMPLQIDATVAYGWCVRTAGYIRSCDVTQAPIATEIKTYGSYNTYTRLGLPIGPISNPGLQALSAAQHPKTSDYLYYLSARDGSRIVYSKTLAEHLANRQKYLGF